MTSRCTDCLAGHSLTRFLTLFLAMWSFMFFSDLSHGKGQMWPAELGSSPWFNNKCVFFTNSLPILWNGVSSNIKWMQAVALSKKIVTLTEQNRLAFKALYICDRYPRASAKPNSHTSFLSSLLGKYCTPCTLYWPVNCGIKKNTTPAKLLQTPGTVV